MLRYSTVAVAQRTPRTRKWVWTGAAVAATAGVAALTARGPIDQHEQVTNSHDQLQQHASALDRIQQQLQKAASLFWPPSSSSSDSPTPSLTTAALNRARATSARWLAQWAVDPDAREALLAFGSNRLLDFLIDTATDDPSPEQAHAEQALCNFLQGYHTSSRLLARPGAISRLLEHIAAGKASDALVERLTALATNRGADLSEGLSQEDGRELIGMLSGGHGQQVQSLALKFLTAWSSAGGAPQCQRLSQSGLAEALGQLAMEAVRQGDSGRQLQKAVCRCQRALLAEPSAVPDEQLANWMQPLLFMAADAAAAAAAAAAASGGRSPYGGLGSSVDGTSSSGGVLGLPGSAADLAVADVAMTTLGAVVAAGGPQVKAALADLHVMPTLDCLALSHDPAIKARAAAALAALVTAGNLEVEEASGRWTDMLLSWLISSTATALHKRNGSSNSGSSSSSGWLLGGLFGSSSSRDEDVGDACGEADPSGEALARSCVAALRALSQQPGPVGLSVAQQWLARILLQLSSRVAAYTSITTLAPADGSSNKRNSGTTAAGAALKAAGAVALADSATAGMPTSQLIKDAAAAVRESGSSSSSEQAAAANSLESPNAAAAASAEETQAAASSSNSSSNGWWWWLGGRWWYGSSTDTSSSSSSNPDDLSSTSADDLWAQLEAAKEAAWRDAAPVTPASAKAAADDLRAASNAMLSSWKTTAALALPSDLVPGMFVPAVEEAYPAAARVVDYAVAQQQTIHVMEVLASVVAEDPTKQTWLLAAGILPLMERLVLHEDAALQPDAFVSKYSSSGSSKGKGQGDKQQSVSDSSDVADNSSSSSGRWWWSWWGSSSGGSSSSVADSSGNNSSSRSGNAQPVQQIGHNFVQQSFADIVPGAAIAPNAQNLHQHVQQRHACDDHGPDIDNDLHLHSFRDYDRQRQDGSNSNKHSSTDSGMEIDSGAADCSNGSSSGGDQGTKQSHKTSTKSGPEAEDEDDDAVSPRDTAAAAAGSFGSWVADGLLSKFTAAAWSTPSSSSDAAKNKTAAAAAAVIEDSDDTRAADQGSRSSSVPQNTATADKQSAAAAAAAAAVAAQEDEVSQPSTPPAAAAAAASTSYAQRYIPTTAMMEFAQGTASWDLITSDVSYPVNSNSSQALQNPSKALDTAAALTAAAEEAPSWSDGNGLGFLCLQRQVARILSMLALQTAAALQLADSALKVDNGALGVLQEMNTKLGFMGQKEVGKSGHVKPSPAELLNPGKATGQRSSSSSSSSSGSQWLPWLLAAAASDDCLLASYATIGLLHLESAVAHQLQQQQQQQAASHGSSNIISSSSTWQQRLAQELQAAEEDIAALIEELWPFNNTAASSSEQGDRGWRPSVYYPDGIHLLNPTSSHHWGLLQPPRATLLESLGAAAASAAATAAAAAASDLAQSEIEALPVPHMPDGIASAAAADVASAAAAAATAAASALGADVSQLSQLQHGSSSEGVSDGSSSNSQSSSSSDTCELGLLQPAVVWLARKLVQLAAVKEEQIHEQQQQQRGISSSSDPSAPLSTYAALQALLAQYSNDNSSNASSDSVMATSQQQQQQQQRQVVVKAGSSSSRVIAAPMHPPQAPDVDIIFIHGIRGGPFVTWRRGGMYKHAPSSSNSKGVGRIADPAASSSSDESGDNSGVPLSSTAAVAALRNHMTKGNCWPAAWLAADLPSARILSVEYKAPVTGWEGESLSLPDSGRLLLEKLVAAGVGQRPVIFVAHSMGGLVVKEMLSQSLEEPPTSRKGRLAAATRAVAFYSTPHFGSGMAALGWKLRHLPGASPAPSIHHLSPGPHLSALNARLALLHETGRVHVLSFTEGLATNLAGLGFLPKIVIVPYESAYPGFGEVCVLADKDHIDVCKPESREMPAYAKLLEFVRASVAAEAAAGGGSSSSSGEQAPGIGCCVSDI